MMALALTSEKDANGLIPKEIAKEIFDGIVESSTVLNVFDRLPNMTSRTRELPVLDALGSASFIGETVNDDLLYGDDEPATYTPREGPAGLKPTHYMKWKGVKIVAESIAVILPVPNEVLADSDYDLWNTMKPRIVEAFGKLIDRAIIWGQGRPSSWATGIVPTAISRGNLVTEGAKVADSVSGLMQKVEQYGFEPTGFLVSNAIKHDIRIAVDVKGNMLFAPGNGTTPDTFWGVPIIYSRNGSFNEIAAKVIVGDMKQAKFAIREDINFTVADTGVLNNDQGEIELNLFQENARAMRVEMRLGWVVPNPIHQLNPDRAGYPFAVMRPKK